MPSEVNQSKNISLSSATSFLQTHIGTNLAISSMQAASIGSKQSSP